MSRFSIFSKLPKAKMVVDSFTGDFEFLSNFYPHPIDYLGKHYLTNEHAFQAAKPINAWESDIIRKAGSPGIAKKLGRKMSLRPDWETIKDQIMLEINAIKFSDPRLKQRLLDTGDLELIEGNYWSDTYWGVCNGKGLNKLGKILMEIRSGLRN